MTLKESGLILSVLRAAYPSSFKGLTDDEIDATVHLWAEMFHEPYSMVSAAVRALISTRKEGYSPTIGEVKDQLYKLTATEELSEAEAWAMVAKACRNGLYGYKTEFEKLPETVKRAVGKAEQLRDWAEIDTDTLNTVVASNFQRSYRIMQQRAKEDALLPPGVKEAVGMISGRMAMALPGGAYE